jgi:methylase of polypeptide subunit release factors
MFDVDRPKTQIVPLMLFTSLFDTLSTDHDDEDEGDTPSFQSPVRKRKTKVASHHHYQIAKTVFQDVMQQLSENSNEKDVSLAFFELANAPTIAYRLPSKQQIVLQQDVTACGEHTGGIVWETSFLLLDYLLQLKSTSKEQYQSLGRTLEVGAGCGLLGQVLAAANCSSEMIVTETEQVLVNLQANLDRNNTTAKVDTTTTTTTSPIRLAVWIGNTTNEMRLPQAFYHS